MHEMSTTALPLALAATNAEERDACPVGRRDSLFHPRDTHRIDPWLNVSLKIIIYETLWYYLISAQCYEARFANWDLASRTDSSLTLTSILARLIFGATKKARAE